MDGRRQGGEQKGRGSIPGTHGEDSPGTWERGNLVLEI